jgi:biopolymer transport protein ExbB
MWFSAVFPKVLMMHSLFALVVAVAMALPGIAHAWWNADWTARKKIQIDASQLQLGAPVTNVPVLVRLHTGNFSFAEADLDGKDLRFIAEDDKTPLEFHVEQFDGTNELALVWVKLPQLASGPGAHFWVYYGNEKAPPASNPKGVYDPSHLAVLSFSEKDGKFADSTQYARGVTNGGVTWSGGGVADGAAAFDGKGRLTLLSDPSLQISSKGFTFSAWVKSGGQGGGALYSQQDGAFQIRVEEGQLSVSAGGTVTQKTSLSADAWHHVVVSVGTETLVYVDGQETARAATSGTAFGGEAVVGAGFVGELDMLQLASVARSADWVRSQFQSQSEAGKLLQVSAEAESGDSGEGASYFAILLGAVTLDGWIVIAILMVMMVISFYVMIAKGIVLSRTDGANKRFQKAFANAGPDLLALEGLAGDTKHASLSKLFETAAAELRKRVQGESAKTVLSAQSIDAIRASLDAVTVRENARLNSQMVLLTIAISGGPFLGLLGTVVGVMITFAAIAAVGDVNVNSIAPGIAAALVATVAGLGVAIPALFGYNYLASQVKNISADMAVFVDELVSRIAERYSA